MTATTDGDTETSIDTAAVLAARASATCPVRASELLAQAVPRRPLTFEERLEQLRRLDADTLDDLPESIVDELTRPAGTLATPATVRRQDSRNLTYGYGGHS